MFKKGDKVKSSQYLSEIERGLTTPSIKTLFKISKFYSITISELLQDVHTV